MTVINESDPKALNNYMTAQYFEFLEVIARVAYNLFIETEFEEYELSWKLKHVLKELIQDILDGTLEENVVTVENFSDEDEDY